MTSRRTARVAEAIREQVSTTVLFELKDPRVKNITILGAEVSPDLRAAKVFVSIMGDEKAKSLCLHGLNSARGFIQHQVAERIQTRYTPVLTFHLDEGIKKSLEAARILREVLPPEIEPGKDIENGNEIEHEMKSGSADTGEASESCDSDGHDSGLASDLTTAMIDSAKPGS